MIGGCSHRAAGGSRSGSAAKSENRFGPLQEDYWNQASEKEEFTTPFQLEVFGNYVSKEQTILDVGCGYGRTLNELRQAGWDHLTFTTMNGHQSNVFYMIGANRKP